MVKYLQSSSMLKTYMTILFLLVAFVLVFLINSTMEFLTFHEMRERMVVKFFSDLPADKSLCNFSLRAEANRTGSVGPNVVISEKPTFSITKASPSTTVKVTTTSKPIPNPARQDNCENCFSHDFKLVINSDSICNVADGGTIDLLVLILTEHSHFNKRNAVRNSWMITAKNNTSNVRYAFTLGEVKDEKLQKEVLEESEKYKDILKENFVDSYQNLTFKTIMGFKYAALHCQNVKYVMKTDDDMWVNVNGLLKLLEKQGGKLKKGVGGSCAQVASPIRDHRSKWYASKLSYPHDRYPGFCSGTGYVTSFEVAKKIYEISARLPFFHLEDVYVAICIRKLGLKLMGLPGFYPYRPNLPWCKYKSDSIITIHQVPPDHLIKAWNEKC